jgi:hypothetical protein
MRSVSRTRSSCGAAAAATKASRCVTNPKTFVFFVISVASFSVSLVALPRAFF